MKAAETSRWTLPPKALIGMIHVPALPGTPAQEMTIDAVIERAAAEARLLAEAGFDALLVENMHDRPYLCREVGPEIVAGMTAVGLAVRAAAALPLGVQVLAGANREALAVALACGACFIRAEGFVFAHVADEGTMEADAGPLLRYRKSIGAEGIAILADIKKKHAAHAITADVGLAETARAAEFFGADGLVVTGTSTGLPAHPEDVQDAKEAVKIPIAVGSGITPANLADYWSAADAFIVGSSIKQDGRWDNPLDPARIERLIAKARSLGGKS
jgi:hypothetical protein